MSTKLRDQFFGEAMNDAFNKDITSSDREVIDECIGLLSEKIKTLGPKGAMEFFAKAGIFDAEQERELTRLLEILEIKEDEACQKSKRTQSYKLQMVS